MPKRTGAKRGHKCGKEFDRYCTDCWERRLQKMHLTEYAGAHTSETTWLPQSILEHLPWTEEEAREGGVFKPRRKRGHSNTEAFYSGTPDTSENNELINTIFSVTSNEIDSLCETNNTFNT